jgi:hypothetical protein
MLGVKAAVSCSHGFPKKVNSFPNISGGCKEWFEAAIFGVTSPKASAKVKEIFFKKGTVYARSCAMIFQEFPVISFRNKGKGTGTHQGKHSIGGFYDQIPSAPGNGRDEECRDLTIAFVFIPVGKLDWIGLNEFRFVDFTVEAIQFLLKSGNSLGPPG